MKLIPKVRIAKEGDFPADAEKDLTGPEGKRVLTKEGHVKMVARAAVQRGHVYMPVVVDTEDPENIKIVHAPPVFFTCEFYAHRRAERYVRAFEKTGKFDGVTSVIAGPAVVNAG